MKRYKQTDQIERRLLSHGKCLRRQILYGGFFRLIAFILLAFILGFLLDYVTRMPYPLRLLLLIGGFGYGIYWFRKSFLLPYARELRPEEVSLEVEEANPELKSRLISMLQFQRPRAVLGPGASMELVDGTCQQAFELSNKLDYSEMIHRPWVRRQLPRCAAGILIIALSVILLPDYMRAYFGRLVLPGVAYPTRTKITRADLPERLPAGDPFTLIVDAIGVLPEMGKVEITAADGNITDLDLTMDPKRQGSYLCAMPPLTDPASVMIYLGDDEHGPVDVTPVPRPHLKGIKLSIEMPAYTVPEGGNRIRVESTGNVKVLEGSNLTMELEISKDLKSIKIVGQDGDSNIGELKKTGKNKYRTSFKAETSFGFTLALLDTDGLEGKDLPVYRISVVRDRPPVIKIERPRGATEAAPVSRIPFSFSVKDDFRVGDIRVLYRVLKADELGSDEDPEVAGPEVAPLNYANFKGDGTGTFTFDGFWENKRIKLVEGQIVRFWIEATDTAEPEAHITKSRDISTRIISAKDYNLMLMQRFGEQEQLIGERIIEIKESERRVKKITESIK